MTEKFEVTYEVDDGYVGKSRLQHFHIDESEIEDDMDEQDLRLLYDAQVDDDFEQKIHAYGENRDEFIAWAKGVINAREEN